MAARKNPAVQIVAFIARDPDLGALARRQTVATRALLDKQRAELRAHLVAQGEELGGALRSSVEIDDEPRIPPWIRFLLDPFGRLMAAIYMLLTGDLTLGFLKAIPDDDEREGWFD